jgi:hypothetical protein
MAFSMRNEWVTIAAATGFAIGAVLSRRCQPDPADRNASEKFTTPAFPVRAGSNDGAIESNQAAYAELRRRKKLELVPGTRPLLEEAGKLGMVTELARTWFLKQLTKPAARAASA